MLGWLQNVIPNLEQEDAVILHFGEGLTQEKTLTVMKMLAIGLRFISDARNSKKVVQVLEASIVILRKASRKVKANIIWNKC